MHLWMPEVAQKLQIAVGATLTGELDDMRRELEKAISAIPAPRTPAERLILRGLLLEFACRCARRAHLALHAATDPTCALDEQALVVSTFTAATENPSHMFLTWLRAYFRELVRLHPVSAVRRAAEILRIEYRQPLNAARLSRTVDLSQRQLRRAFHNEFGMTLRDYQGRLRVLASLHPVMNSKSEAAALDAGYRSRKNFYAWFRRFTGLTPIGFRRLSDEGRQHLEDRLRLSLAGRSTS